MHNKIIMVFKELFNKKDNDNINIKEQVGELRKEFENSIPKEEANKVKYSQSSKNIVASKEQLKILRNLAKGVSVNLNLKNRSKIIIEVLNKSNNSQVAKKLKIKRDTVIKWEKRWLEQQIEFERIEKNEKHKLKSSIRAVLSDEYRSGKKITFTMEQIAHLINLSLQEPESVNVPISHWTSRALKEKLIEGGIFEEISERQVLRYLKQIDIKVHQYKGWLNSQTKIKDPEEFERNVKMVCEIYINSKQLEKEGVHVISVDEKTGIQAIENKHPVKLVLPGSIEKREQEYIRHGTTTLIASRDINTGQIIAPLIQQTRNEEDFLKHISDVVDLAPEDKYIFIMDQLNTHKSESLVTYIADVCNIKDDLGKKGSHGILKSMVTRQEFLADDSHRIYFAFTPKHSSWMNQIEMWFGILGRMLLNKRSSFNSVKNLEDKITNFIEYYNKNLAKPFKWTYEGKLLKI